MTLAATHTHSNRNIAMETLNRTITTQNNAHQTSTTLNPTSWNNTYTDYNTRQKRHWK